MSGERVVISWLDFSEVIVDLQICGCRCTACGVSEDLGLYLLIMFSYMILLAESVCSYLLTLLMLVINLRCWWLLLLVRTAMVGRNDYK
jgi:hypothetical protein